MNNPRYKEKYFFNNENESYEFIGELKDENKYLFRLKGSSSIHYKEMNKEEFVNDYGINIFNKDNVDIILNELNEEKIKLNISNKYLIQINELTVKLNEQINQLKILSTKEFNLNREKDYKQRKKAIRRKEYKLERLKLRVKEEIEDALHERKNKMAKINLIKEKITL